VGWTNVIVTATRYELDDPGNESRWGRNFSHPFWTALGPSFLDI